MADENPVDALYRKLREKRAAARAHGPTPAPLCFAIAVRGDSAFLLTRPDDRCDVWLFPRASTPVDLARRLGVDVSALAPKLRLPFGQFFSFDGDTAAPDILWTTPSRDMWLGPEERIAVGAHRADRSVWDALADHGRARERVIADGVTNCALASPTLPPAEETNCYVLGDREFVVVDPAAIAPSEQDVILKLIAGRVAGGAGFRGVVLTHYHGDHVGTAAEIARAFAVPVFAHAETKKRLAGRVDVDQLLSDGQTFPVDEVAWQVLVTPGHAPGHVCLFDPANRFLVAGDMVAGLGTILIDPADGNMTQYLASLARLEALEPRCLLPAHGPPLFGPKHLAKLRMHRLWREKLVLDALGREPVALSELVRTVYSDVPEGVRPLAERSLLAHLLKLESDGAAAVREGTWVAL